MTATVRTPPVWEWRKASGGLLALGEKPDTRLFHAYDSENRCACNPHQGLTESCEEPTGASDFCPYCLAIVRPKTGVVFPVAVGLAAGTFAASQVALSTNPLVVLAAAVAFPTAVLWTFCRLDKVWKTAVALTLPVIVTASLATVEARVDVAYERGRRDALAGQLEQQP